MSDHEVSNRRSPSTTTEWKWAKIRRRPQGPPEASLSAAKSFRGLPPRDPREPVTVTLRYLGGGECWIELQARGRRVKVPGHLCILDALFEIVGIENQG